MTPLFPEIASSSLSEKDLRVFHSLDQETYGRELAGKVAKKLKQGPLYHAHRDYCGIGLYFFEGKFTLGEVYDGMGPHPVLIAFESQEEFVEWLAKQSDQRMSLMVSDDRLFFNFNNQTITKIRLEYFLEDDYSPVWNSYCAYVRKRSLQ